MSRADYSAVVNEDRRDYLEALISELNESDILSGLRELSNSIGCLDQNETPEGFQAALDDAIDEAATLLHDLRELKQKT